MVLHEAELRRNRLRIVPVALLGALNYWLAAIIVTVCAIVGTVVAFALASIFEADLWDVAIAVGRLLVEVADVVDWSAVGLVTLIGFVAIGTIAAVVLIVRHLRGVEATVVRETGATIADPNDLQPDVREVANLLAGLAIAADVPVPRFAVVEDPAPNAFAVGRRPERVLVGVTTGLLDSLSRAEVEAVLASEISRIATFDVALSTWAVALTGKTITFADEAAAGEHRLRGVLLAPSVFIAEWLRGFALRDDARKRDMIAVRFTRNPRALLDALETLERDRTVVRNVSRATAPLWFESAAPPTRSRWARRFTTEPSLAERIALVRALLREPGPGSTLTDEAARPDGPEGE